MIIILVQLCKYLPKVDYSTNPASKLITVLKLDPDTYRDLPQ